MDVLGPVEIAPEAGRIRPRFEIHPNTEDPRIAERIPGRVHLDVGGRGLGWDGGQVGFKAMMNLQFDIRSRRGYARETVREACSEQVRGLIDWRHGQVRPGARRHFVRLSQKRRTGPIMSPSRRIVIDVGDDFEGGHPRIPQDVDEL